MEFPPRTSCAVKTYGAVVGEVLGSGPGSSYGAPGRVRSIQVGSKFLPKFHRGNAAQLLVMPAGVGPYVCISGTMPRSDARGLIAQYVEECNFVSFSVWM